MQNPAPETGLPNPLYPDFPIDVTRMPVGAPFPDHRTLDLDDSWRRSTVVGSSGGRRRRRLSQVAETLEVVALVILMFMAVRATCQNFIRVIDDPDVHEQ
jgi:hypothetical protein